MHTTSLEIAKTVIDAAWVTRIKGWLQDYSGKMLHITEDTVSPPTYPRVFGGVIYVIAALERLEEAWAANTRYIAERDAARAKVEALQKHADGVNTLYNGALWAERIAGETIARLKREAAKAEANRNVDLQFLMSSLQSKCDKQRADITRLTKKAEADASLMRLYEVGTKVLVEQRDACYEKLPALTQWGLCQQFLGMKMDMATRKINTHVFDRPFTSADENREAAKANPYNSPAVSSIQDTAGCTQSAATPVSTLTDRVGRLEPSVFGRRRG